MSYPEPQINNASEIAKEITGTQRRMIAPESLRPEVTGAQEMPARYFTRDPREEDITMRHQYVNKFAQQMGKQAPIVIDQVTPEEIQIMKQKERENIRFSAFEFAKGIIKPEQNVAAARYMKETFPEVAQLQLDEVRYKFAIQERLARIKITGDPTRDDWLFLFAIQSMAPEERDKFEEWLADPVYKPKVNYANNIKNRGALSFKKFLGTAPRSADDSKFLLGDNGLGFNIGNAGVTALGGAGDGQGFNTNAFRGFMDRFIPNYQQ